MVDSPPALAPEVEQMVERDHLCFGHWEIGDQHNIFVVLLRALGDDEIASVFSRLKAATDTSFAGEAPDFVIFPGESTAIHLAPSFAVRLGADKAAVVASPAFRAYGKHLLRLEMSSAHIASLREKKRLNVLFFDDSLSSGDTEIHALDAFLRQTAKLRVSPAIRWLTFSVLWRGQRLVEGGSLRKREAPRTVQSKAKDIQYTFESFGVIGPESLSRAECPLCRASRCVHNAVAWAYGVRPAVRRELEELDDLLQPRSIERLAFPAYHGRGRSRHPLSCLDAAITKVVLRIEAMRMTEACIYIWHHFVQRNCPTQSVQEMLGTLLFCGLHYADVGGYISSDASIAMIQTAAQRLDSDAGPQREAFLIALSAFPASTLESVAPSLTLVFAQRGAVDLGSLVLAMAFSAQHSTLLESSTLQGMDRRQQLLARLRTALVCRVKAQLDAVPGQGMPGFGANQELVATDLAIVSQAPREENPAWVARTLAALLHGGRHASFLSKQIDDLSDSTVSIVRDGLLQALQLMRRLPALAIEHLEKQMADLATRIQTCSDSDVHQCRTLAKDVIDGLWRRNIRQRFFLHPKVLDRELRRLTVEPVTLYHQTGLKTEHFCLMECEDSLLPWEVFGPDLPIVRGHFTNLLVNPVKHFPLSCFAACSADPPVAVGYFTVDESTQRLLLVVADRSQPPEREKLFALSHGLAHHRAYLQLFGGDLEHDSAPQGFHTSEHPPTERQMHSFRARRWDPSLYKSLFVTSFPLVLKGT